MKDIQFIGTGNKAFFDIAFSIMHAGKRARICCTGCKPFYPIFHKTDWEHNRDSHHVFYDRQTQKLTFDIFEADKCYLDLSGIIENNRLRFLIIRDESVIYDFYVEDE